VNGGVGQAAPVALIPADGTVTVPVYRRDMPTRGIDTPGAATVMLHCLNRTSVTLMLPELRVSVLAVSSTVTLSAVEFVALTTPRGQLELAMVFAGIEVVFGFGGGSSVGPPVVTLQLLPPIPTVLGATIPAEAELAPNAAKATTVTAVSANLWSVRILLPPRLPGWSI